MSDSSIQIKSVFLQAVEIENAQEREQFLDRATHGDSAARERIQELIRSFEKAGSFMKQAATPAFENTVTTPISEKPGDTLGPYKLLQEIGEGGFGVVYMAEQIRPMRRKVALKIIKPGMDSKEVIARFEAERQALALMDHPNIAKVLDAGATDSGRPYFVMELVKGVPLTEYCDRNHLSAQERLQLFADVCRAVQHAHQKGVIHRDLKPSNIMVTLHDGNPVPKVIDFGVSKALSQQLTEKTLFTAYGQMVGTPAYMSPEQAEMSGLDVDTRSDVYSLGVLLYEMLTGSTPLDSQRLRSAGYAEMQRIIREEEPIRPSTRLTSLGDQATVVSRNRGTDPKRLGQLVRGDLDWIVMKALEKERNRRYETANGLVADIERFLRDEPVVACPPSTFYRFRKFARRNRASLAIVASVGVLLLAMTAASLVAAGKFRALARHNAALAGEKQRALVAETRAKNAAHAAQVNAERARDQEKLLRKRADEQARIAQEALSEAQQQRERAEANFVLARSAVDEFLNRVTENELLRVPGLQQLRQELLSSAMDFYEDFAQDEENSGELMVELASAHYRLACIRAELGQRAMSTSANEEAVQLFEKLHKSGNTSLRVQLGLAEAYSMAKRFEDAANLCQRILEAHPDNAAARSHLAQTYNSLAISHAEDHQACVAYHQKALEIRESLVSDFPDDPEHLANLGSTINNLAVQMAALRKRAQALRMYQTAVRYTEKAFEQSPQTILWGRWLGISLRNVARMQATLGQPDALKTHQRLVTLYERLVFENPAVPAFKSGLSQAWRDLAEYQRDVGRSEEANRSFQEASRVMENIAGDTPESMLELALVYSELARPSDDVVQRPTADESDREHQQYADQAMTWLSKAIVAGYDDASTLREHRSLDAIRGRDDFQELVTKLEESQELAGLSARLQDVEPAMIAQREKDLDALREYVKRGDATLQRRRTLATALDSIGEIHLSRRQFNDAQEALLEALAIREELHAELGETPLTRLQLLDTQCSLGQLDWDRGRLPEAHERWKNVLAQLEQLSLAQAQSEQSEDKDTQSLLGSVAELERRICEQYAQLGLWPLAAEHAVRNVELQRVTNTSADHNFAPLLLLLGTDSLYRDYCRVHYEHVKQLVANYPKRTAGKMGDALWLAALNPQATADTQQLAQIGEEILSGNPLNEGWIRFGLAGVQYRVGRAAEALDTLSGYDWDADVRGPVTPSAWYLTALAESQIGHHESADAALRKAEARYRDVCRESALSTDPTLASPFNDSWWELLCAQRLRREALATIENTPPGDDLWQHLIQARGFHLIGETDRAEAEMRAAATAKCDDVQIWMTRAQLWEHWGEQDRAESDWQRAVELAKDDPLPWIQRGRWYAQRGIQDKADADFAKAASMTPQELNKFLEAGWWVIGPYPSNLEEFCPPELAPDPSQAVHVFDPRQGLSDEPVSWMQTSPDAEGRLGLRKVIGTDQGSAYAFTYVYSPDERTVLLRACDSRGMRIWCNRQLVFSTKEKLGDSPAGERIPIALKQGRNELLLKFPLGDRRTVRLGDSPLDLALTFAELRLWDAAEELFLGPVRVQLASSSKLRGEFAEIALLNDHPDVARNECEAMFEQFHHRTGIWNAYYTTHAISLAHPRFIRRHREEFSRFIDILESEGTNGHFELTAALLKFHLGRDDEAAAWFENTDQQFAIRLGRPLRAMLAWKRGDVDGARKWLDRAESFVVAYTSDLGHHVPHVLTSLLLFREAELLVTGESERSDALIEKLRLQAREYWDSREPLTAAFDDALRTNGAAYSNVYDRDKQAIALHVARGRRFAQLERFDDAAKDFREALALNPNNRDALLARAECCLQRGDLSVACDAFQMALWRADGPVSKIEQRLRLHEAVLAEFQRRHPENLVFWRVAALGQFGHREWKRALQSLQAGQHWTHSMYAVRLHCLLDDPNGYQRTRRQFVELLDDEPDIDEQWLATQRMQTLALQPLESDSVSEMERYLDQQRAFTESGNRHALIGLALFRLGRWQEALEAFETGLPRTAWQENAVYWPVVAMTHWHLGQRQEAQKWLERSRWWVAFTSRAADIPQAIGPGSIHYTWWLNAHVFHREAEQMIAGAGRDLEAGP